MTSSDRPSRPKLTLDQILAEKKAGDNARRRQARLRDKLTSLTPNDTSSTPQGGDQSPFQAAIKELEHSYLRKGETLAFPDKLEPYQLEAVLMTVRNYRTGVPTLNASDVGLGKTREAASFLATTMPGGRVLWLTFKNLVPQTCNEISELDPNRIVAVPINDQSETYLTMMHPALSAPTPSPSQSNAPSKGKCVVYVTNYEVLHRDNWLFKPSPNHTLPINPQLNDPKHPVAYAPSGGFEFPKGPQWDCIVVDEATKLRNGASYSPPQIYKRTKMLLHRCHPEAYRLFLTATPAENKPEELWAYFHLFKPDRFKDLAAFKRIFEAYDPQTGKPMVDVERLLAILGGMVIRHTVTGLGLDMPSLDRPEWFNVCTHSLTIDPDSHVGQAYLSMQNEALAELSAEATLNPKVMLEVMLRLRQLLSAGPVFTYTKTTKSLVLDASDPTGYAHSPDTGLPLVKKDKQLFTVNMRPPYTKHDAVEELIARLQGEGEQVIVMSCFNQPLINLHNSLSRTGVYTSAVINGDTTLQERTKLIRRFQQAELDVLLVNKRAAAHGLNLQKCSNWPGGASHIIHMDRWWSPAVERQANGRIVRMNTLYPCTAHYFEVENSMDTAMRDLVQAKADGINMMDAELIKTTMERNQLG